MIDRNFTVTIEDSQGPKEVKFRLNKPTNKQAQDAMTLRTRTEFELMKQGVPTLKDAIHLWHESGVWTDEDEVNLRSLENMITDKLVSLQKGDGMSLWDARMMCIDIMELRGQMRMVSMERQRLESKLAERRAEQAEADFLVFVLTVFADTGKPVFKSLDDLRDDENPYVGPAYGKFFDIQYNIPEHLTSLLPEVAFLKHMNFIDEEGNFLDEEGKVVDRNGNPIVEKPVIEERGPAMFLDKNGNPVTIDFTAIMQGNMILKEQQDPDDPGFPDAIVGERTPEVATITVDSGTVIHNGEINSFSPSATIPPDKDSIPAAIL